ncbi:hypothetical protein Cob_v009104 [Colletotrichum orbiculare MAFF 240422]|uniref:Uncharacterized protein n=1 Tax=Colletotrichum orbiculare (strain 104-T / ATCC 96160 / CBS 514.97 / LARS 414 / MAFF 240422) TaxID=1213857 RepID=A0A484FJM1_COLOR|nr:hypothetical protein Cob_v009104 [Colletotrichum orbiculare MAFF 240422]
MTVLAVAATPTMVQLANQAHRVNQPSEPSKWLAYSQCLIRAIVGTAASLLLHRAINPGTDSVEPPAYSLSIRSRAPAIGNFRYSDASVVC